VAYPRACGPRRVDHHRQRALAVRASVQQARRIWPRTSRRVCGVARRRHRARSAVRLVRGDQAATRRMVVELSLGQSNAAYVGRVASSRSAAIVLLAKREELVYKSRMTE